MFDTEAKEGEIEERKIMIKLNSTIQRIEMEDFLGGGFFGSMF